MFYFSYAFKSLFERFRQYRSLFMVCTVAIGIIFSLLMITDGMVDSLRNKAKYYYGGDLQFVGGSNDDKTLDEAMAQKVRAILPEGVRAFKRFNHDYVTTLYFEGVNVFVKLIKGVDFGDEKELFANFTFAEGSYPAADEENVILLSEPIATKLGVHVGDSITVYTETVDYYHNTAEVIVKGIFQDSSMFGMYVTYMDIASLRLLGGYQDGFYDKLGIYKTHGTFSNHELKTLHALFSQHFPMVSLSMDKWELHDLIEDSAAGDNHYALITLEMNRKEMAMLISAIQTVVLLVIIPLLLIVAVGIGSSYRVIVLKRTVETGTLRSIGMRPSGIIRLFVAESMVLLLAGFIAGFVLCGCINTIVSQFNLSFIPAFDIFLQGGHLIPFIHFGKNLAMILIIVVTTLGAVLFTVRNLIHTPPVYALNTTV